ncbi:MAG TPA: L,D-transpeptidase family protein [Kaistiaceae bacterium]|nr:L,D-transpeptidase family protein [Kaistiaceae bacterium]
MQHQDRSERTEALSKMKRRAMRAALTLVLATLVSATVRPALAQSPLEALINAKLQAEWTQRFDSGEHTNVRGSEATLSPQTAINIEQAIQRYSAIVASGGWPKVATQTTLRIGVRAAAVMTLRQRLKISGDLDANSGNGDAYDSYVAEAVRRFQERHGIIADGVVRGSTFAALNVPADVRLQQLETNLVRVRAMSGFLGDRYVMVNIPAAEIEAVDMGQVASRHIGVVGKIDRQTPIVASRITELNFNPFWTVPLSIIKKDLIPKMKEDPQYLTKNKIRIYDGYGSELLPEQINWDSDEATKYMFRQDPGEINSLGNVRINFSNPHNVYLHDTPSKTLFGKDYRFHSSGCVRVQNVRELVTWLLRDTPGWSRAQIDATIQSGERTDVKLVEPVPIYTTYITAWATSGGVVNFRDDIYNRDGLGQYAQN